VAIELLPSGTISAGATRLVAVDLTSELDSGVLLTGTPTVTESTGTLTLTNKAVSTAALEINDKTVAIGKAVQFLVDAASASDGTTYTIAISVGTDSTPAETLKYDYLLTAT